MKIPFFNYGYEMKLIITHKLKKIRKILTIIYLILFIFYINKYYINNNLGIEI